MYLPNSGNCAFSSERVNARTASDITLHEFQLVAAKGLMPALLQITLHEFQLVPAKGLMPALLQITLHEFQLVATKGLIPALLQITLDEFPLTSLEVAVLLIFWKIPARTELVPGGKDSLANGDGCPGCSRGEVHIPSTAYIACTARVCSFSTL